MSDIWHEVFVCGVFALLYTVIFGKGATKWFMERQLTRSPGSVTDRLVAQRVKLGRSLAYSLCACIPVFSRVDYPLVIGVCLAIAAFVFGITWAIQGLIEDYLQS